MTKRRAFVIAFSSFIRHSGFVIRQLSSATPGVPGKIEELWAS
jgi:hypothetical protein